MEKLKQMLRKSRQIKKFSEQKQRFPEVSIITSLYNADEFIRPFLDDITRQTVFGKCELIIINANSPGNEESVIKEFTARYPNIIYKRLDSDPGIYGVWKIAIEMARGEYITNANVDDRRAPHSIERHMKELDENPNIDVVCAQILVTAKKNETWENNSAIDIWLWEKAPNLFETEDMFKQEWKNGIKTGRTVSYNIPHCMPMWRKRIHEKNGYFDEKHYGALADWEFWLRCSTKGVKFKRINELLGLYLSNPGSYSGRDPRHREVEKEIVKKYYKDYYPKILIDSIKEKSNHKTLYPQKINIINALGRHYGNHRCGWVYALDCLVALHKDSGILLDGFIEKKFCWGIDIGDFRNNPEPYAEPWVGFIHNPQNMPKWFQYEQSPQSIFKSKLWKKSIRYCKGLFCLSDYHKKWLEENTDVPIERLLFPTELARVEFSMEKFLANNEKRIVQIGWWLRKLNSIYYVPTKRIKKAFLDLNLPHAHYLVNKERKTYGLKLDYSSVEKINFLPPHEYDELLSKNIVYLDLYDSSANNTVIECIARNTPILVNPLPAVREYLGEYYPLYFTSREEAAEKAEDFSLIEKTHNYLKNHPIKEKLTAKYFLKSFAESEIYDSL